MISHHHDANIIYTIGHSSHRIERFVELLNLHGISAVADVRSSPYSRFNPQFNRKSLDNVLGDNSIRYVFLGDELGARSKDPYCYDNGLINYTKLAATALFKNGLDRLQEGMMTYKVVIMCAEKEPLNCHRTILIARALETRGITISHILEDGSLEPHASTLLRLRQQLQIPNHDLFKNDSDLFDEAYSIQSQRIAYVDHSVTTHSS